jgi:prophage antirepressor-like protein
MMQNELTLIKSDYFGDSQCDFWEDNDGNPNMTINQLGKALGYASKSGVENIISRNSYLKGLEFSSTHRLWVDDGKMRETRIFTEDGIYEVAFLAGTEKAQEFRAWVRKILKGLRTGDLTLQINRQVGKIIRRELTDALKESGLNEKMHGFGYKTFTDLIYKLVLNMTAKQYREQFGLSKNANVREYVNQYQLHEIGRWKRQFNP